MRYLIDGYNLLFALGLLTKQTGRDGVAPARHRLFEFLHAQFGDDSAHISIVFDAAGAPRSTPAEEFHRGLHVYYALSEEADDLIEDLIRRESIPHDLTVVSDDRRIREAARRRGCVVLRCLDFVEQTAFPATPTGSTPADSAAKPDLPSPQETADWLREFGDIERDPALKPFLRQDDFDRDE
jgi:predicted RNA-binding protein with PIN domain